MSTDATDASAPMSPDQAFATLGNQTRMTILRTLGEHDGDPLSFSELHEAVDMRDSGQFNYHLDQLVGHFVEKTDDGYTLRQAGRRVIEAVLSGAVTHDPVLERTEIDHTCHYCGAPLEMSYRQESTATFCTGCAGAYEQSTAPDESSVPDEEYGFMGYLHLPPAGLADRSPTAVHEVAFTWQLAEVLPAANGVCPRCSAPISEDASLCGDHDTTEGLCPTCGNRHAIQHAAQCTNCVFEQVGPFVLKLLGTTELIAFLTVHGINPVAPSPERFGSAILDYDETVLSADPFDASFTFETDGEELTLRVDDDLSVADVTGDPTSDPQFSA